MFANPSACCIIGIPDYDSSELFACIERGICISVLRLLTRPAATTKSFVVSAAKGGLITKWAHFAKTLSHSRRNPSKVSRDTGAVLSTSNPGYHAACTHSELDSQQPFTVQGNGWVHSPTYFNRMPSPMRDPQSYLVNLSVGRFFPSVSMIRNILWLTLAAFLSSVATGADNEQTAPHRGVLELQFRAGAKVEDPYFDTYFHVTFVRPDGSHVTTDGFYDGDQMFRVRAYCDTLGVWKWSTSSSVEGLDGQRGTFQVVQSSLPGKLSKHPDDSRQLVYDNGKWFLHIGDTGYRYVVRDEEHWREYIDQAGRMGATKIRTWFCQSRHNVEALFNPDRSDLNLGYWQEIDRRIAYALRRHPHVMLQLILFGEDTEELKRYAAGDRMSRLMVRYAQARFSAYPNILWCLSNDREIVSKNKPLTGRRIRGETIDGLGKEMATREPWGTLFTNHQSRFTGYSFVDASWSDIITLEDLDQVSGELILKYRKLGDDPIVLDADRYEQYRAPRNPRYFFRRLMWSSLFSGGSATYGGLRTYEPLEYIPTRKSQVKNSEGRGLHGYYDAVRHGWLKRGGDDFVYIHKFFTDAGLTLVGMQPADETAGGDSTKCKCIQGNGVYLVYLANPDGADPGTDAPSGHAPTVTLQLPDHPFSVKWFNPTSGVWTKGEAAGGVHCSFNAPSSGDWVLLLSQTDLQNEDRHPSR